MIILQTVPDKANIAIWPWPILKVKVNVMHISSVNNLQTVTDRANMIANANKYKVKYDISIVVFRLDLDPF